VFSLLALANLYLARRTLAFRMTTPGPSAPPVALAGGFDKKTFAFKPQMIASLR
jgi:hypothetical protein